MAVITELWGDINAGVTLLSTELDGLTASYGSAYGPEVGGANSPQIGMLALHLDANSDTFIAGSEVRVMLVPSTTPLTSGGTYPSYTSGATPVVASQNYNPNVIYVFPGTLSSGVVNELCFPVIIPPGFFKAILINDLASGLPSANNTVKLYTVPTIFQ